GRCARGFCAHEKSGHRAAFVFAFAFAFALLFSLAWVDAAENCQRPEGWGRAGYPRHGWRG
ncbi:hypothetical protein ORG27_08425, partial [Stenotrophomonas lactitubi]|uniref:hypothetical protein n=1 Tax=Stenotrophomonas lactitubi TaxID=2045214 RepID=UPI0022496FFF